MNIEQLTCLIRRDLKLDRVADSANCNIIIDHINRNLRGVIARYSKQTGLIAAPDDNLMLVVRGVCEGEKQLNKERAQEFSPSVSCVLTQTIVSAAISAHIEAATCSRDDRLNIY